MFASSREDDLLNKLKNCVGGLKQDTTPPLNAPLSNRTNENYNCSSQKYSSLHVSNQKVQHSNHIPYDRQPLTPNSNNARPLLKTDTINEGSYKSKMQYDIPAPSSRSYQTELLMVPQNRNYGSSIDSTFNPSAFGKEQVVPKPNPYRLSQENFNISKPYSIEQQLTTKHQIYKLGQEVTPKQQNYISSNNSSNIKNLCNVPSQKKPVMNRYQREYGNSNVKIQPSHREVQPQLNNYLNQEHRPSTVKNDIARRYSMMQIQKTSLPYRQQVRPNYKQIPDKPSSTSYATNPTGTHKQTINENKLYAKPTTYNPYPRQNTNNAPRQTQSTRQISKGYQQELQQRRSIIEQDIDRTIQKVSQTARKEINAGSIRKQISSSIKNDISSSTNKQPIQKTFDYRPRRQPLPQNNPQTINKPQSILQMRETLNFNLKDQGECSALGKLKKISELNEKINDRIRNIINVFQDHK